MRKTLFVLLLNFSLYVGAWAQTKTQSPFVSALDEALTVRTVYVAPVEDNLSGIYARPVEEHLKEAISKDTRWSLSEFNDPSGFKLHLLYSNPEEVVRLGRAAKADGILKTKITKGPAGMSAKMTLFSGSDGLPLVEENFQGLQKFEIGQVNAIFEKMLWSLRNRLPYRAEVVSRKGQDITVNFGKNEKVKPGSEISIIQVLKVNRHPKLNFVVSTEKEILGKAKVYKVDDTLSFAKLIMEREAGAVQVGGKVLPDEYVRYSEPYITEDGQVLTDLNERKDKDLSYGEKPAEWLPESPAQYGKFNALVGLSQYTQTANFTSIGGVDGSNNFAPTLNLNGELWISPEWFMGLELRSAAFSVNNGQSGSSPGKINMSLNSYAVQVGHTFLMSPDFFGPKIQVSGGIAKFSARADVTNPLTFTSTEFGGMFIGFTGQFPINEGEAHPTDVGVKYRYYWRPSVSETDSSGASRDVRITDFGFFFNYHQTSRFSYTGELKFEYYSANFDGTGVRPVTSGTHKLTSLLFGIEYLF